MKTCPKCSAENRDEALRCKNCGAVISSGDYSRGSTAPPPPPPSLRHDDIRPPSQKFNAGGGAAPAAGFPTRRIEKPDGYKPPGGGGSTAGGQPPGDAGRGRRRGETTFKPVRPTREHGFSVWTIIILGLIGIGVVVAIVLYALR